MSVSTALSPAPEDRINDPFRLAAVLNSGLLDTEPEAAFDDLTRLAAMLIGAPYAFATVVDDRRSFWKSRYGVPAGGPRQNSVRESFCRYVVNANEELIVNDAAADERTRDNPSVESMGVAAWAGFPLMDSTGEVLGTFCVVDTRVREWTPHEIDILKTLASVASREVARQRAIVDERAALGRAEALTHSLQESLLPPRLPVVPGLDISARFRPAGLGVDLVGDFYDVFETPAGWSFVIGDVCGKGIEAAKAATLARHTVGAACMRRSDPADVMRFFNETFLARRRVPDLFLTAMYGTLDVNAGGCTIRLANAGHLPPVLRRADGSSRSLEVYGPLIGVFPDLDIDEVSVELTPGESLIVFTDGVSESRGAGGLYGEDAVREIVAAAGRSATADALAARIESAALSFGGGIASDDIAILVIRVPEKNA